MSNKLVKIVNKIYNKHQQQVSMKDNIKMIEKTINMNLSI